MSPSEVTALLSAGIAVVAAIVSVFAFVQQRKSSQLSLNIAFLNESLKQLTNRPGLLSLHNIDLDELAKDGIHIDEFVYMLSSVYAGQSYHALGGRGKIQLSDYRQNLLRNPKFRMAWTKYIRRNMTGQTRYAMAIDAFYGVAAART